MRFRHLMLSMPNLLRLPELHDSADGAAPTNCDISCAVVYAPFWAECFDLLAMALGHSGGHRLLQATAGGGIAPWEALANTCSSIDATRLLLAIKDLTEQGCYSASLANECEVRSSLSPRRCGCSISG